MNSCGALQVWRIGLDIFLNNCHLISNQNIYYMYRISNVYSSWLKSFTLNWWGLSQHTFGPCALEKNGIILNLLSTSLSFTIFFRLTFFVSPRKIAYCMRRSRLKNSRSKPGDSISSKSTLLLKVFRMH